MLQDVSIELSV